MKPISDKAAQDLVDQLIRALRERRTSAGVSMHRLARLTGLHASTISLIEGGQRSPSLFVVLKLAAALNLNLESIGHNSESHSTEESVQ